MTSYVGPYRLLNLIRSSRTAQIWEVILDGERSRFAMKRLLVGEQQSKEEIKLLKHEYEVGRNLKHPRIIEFVEFSQYKGEVYLVMELYSSPNLKQILQAQGFESIAPVASRITEQAAESLAYLASQNWVHRDVKPDNFLVDEEGNVKLIDFALAERKKTGLAKMFAGKSKVQGTPSYMSPEQIRGQVVDSKADVYSLGCMLYELVSGKKAYTGASTNDLLNKHLRGAVPVVEVHNPNITAEFSQLLRQMMAKKPDGRPELEQLVAAMRATPIFKIPPAQAAAAAASSDN